ncbi:MAG: hypothetical protein RJA22_2058 [Verrucomicrobiota bacterium]
MDRTLFRCPPGQPAMGHRNILKTLIDEKIHRNAKRARVPAHPPGAGRGGPVRAQAAARGVQAQWRGWLG